MIRTLGSSAFTRRDVIDAIVGGALHVRSRTHARWEVELETIEIVFPEQDLG